MSVTYYQLLPTSSGKWHSRQVELNIESSAKIIDIHALAIPSSNGVDAQTIIFQGTEFSSLEWGSELYPRVAQQILNLRKDDESYPIYITDVKLAQPVSTELPLQSIHYFQYKKAIEEKLTSALRAAESIDKLNEPLASQ